MASERLNARKVVRRPSQQQLKLDLEKYRNKALELGAADAKVIPASHVVVDERVRLKCAVPRCHLYGECMNCPPYTLPPGQMRKVLKKYKCAVLFKTLVSPVRDFVDDDEWHVGHMVHQRRIHDIAGAIEALAFNDGYYLAAGFAAGGCKTALCSGQVCQFLDSGRCRFPLKARPSMEGVGIDVFDLVTRVGWDVYPIAVRGVDPDSVLCAISVGIVFIHQRSGCEEKTAKRLVEEEKDILEVLEGYVPQYDSRKWAKLSSTISYRRLVLTLLKEILVELRKLNQK